MALCAEHKTKAERDCDWMPALSYSGNILNSVFKHERVGGSTHGSHFICLDVLLVFYR